MLRRCLFMLLLLSSVHFSFGADGDVVGTVDGVFFHGSEWDYSLSVLIGVDQYFIVERTHPNFDGLAAFFLSYVDSDILIQVYHEGDYTTPGGRVDLIIIDAGRWGHQ